MHLQLFSDPSSCDVGTVLASERERALLRPLSVLVGPDRAVRMLRKVGANGLEHFSAEELTEASGLPVRLAERLVAARDLMAALERNPMPSASNPQEVLSVLPPGLARYEREVLLGVPLTGRNRVKAVIVLAVGGITGTAAVPRDIFIPIIRTGAAAFCLVHNHPSGDPSPSTEDITMTKAVAESADILGLTLVDHLVVASGGVVSLAERGLMDRTRRCA